MGTVPLKAPSMAELVSVIVPTIKEQGKKLKRLRASLRSSLHQNHEIIVEDGQYGLAAARNRGARRARGRYLLFIDDDNIITPDMIGKLVKAVESQNTPDGCILAVGPITYYLSEPRRVWFMGSKLNLTTSKPYFYREPVSKQMLTKRLMQVENLHNCFLVRKELGDQVNWFDESLVMGGTEFDFFRRVQKLNPDLVLALHLGARCYHDISTPEKNRFRSLGFSHPRRAYFFQRNRAILISRYSKWWQKLLFALIFYPFFTLAYAGFFLRFRRLEFLKAHLKATLAGYLYLIK